jgi:hypothetical protein
MFILTHVFTTVNAQRILTKFGIGVLSSQIFDMIFVSYCSTRLLRQIRLTISKSSKVFLYCNIPNVFYYIYNNSFQRMIIFKHLWLRVLTFMYRSQTIFLYPN